MLFGRAAEYLFRSGYKIKIYEDKVCYLSKFLKRKGVDFVTSSEKAGSKFIVGQDEFFIFSLAFTSRVLNLFGFHKSNRFLFWDIHHTCLMNLLAFFDVYNRITDYALCGKFIHLLERSRATKIETFNHLGSSKNGIVFMSAFNLMVNEKLFSLPEKVNFLPIILPVNNTPTPQSHTERVETDVIRIGWISRLKRHKINILSLLVDDVCNSIQNIELTIIGDGEDSEMIEAYVASKKVKNITFAGRIESENLEDYLIDNIDLGFSVGTSALEFAKCKIPTVFAPVASQFKDFSTIDNKYAWLQNVSGYDVSSYVEKMSINQSFDSIIEDYKKDYVMLGEAAYEYVYQNHGIDAVGSRLLRVIENNEFTFNDIQNSGLTKRSMYEKFTFYVRDIYKKLKRSDYQ